MPARTAMPPAPDAERIRDVNTRYHDAAAAEYDAKWGIDFGPVGRRQVGEKLARALGPARDRRYGDALEIGAGTGYFSLNLLQLGRIERATATDISQGMLDTLSASAAQLDLDVPTVRSGAEQLPFADRSFDLVFGHAVLHHIPDLTSSLRELRRVLRPGGVLAFCGEPSRHGDRLAALPKRLALAAAPLWRRALGVRPHDPEPVAGGYGDLEEWEIDVHSFAPGELRAMLVDAGFDGVRIRGEELVASTYGWALRTLEATADPDTIPHAWRLFAFRSYLAVRRLDTALAEPLLPPQLFYNLVLSAERA